MPRPGARSKDDLPAGILIAIEHEPLRASAAADCQNAMARLKQTRAGWHHFERKDKPAFARWRAREFGALLSNARDVETQIRDAQALIHEVEMEMRRAFQHPYSAYQRVMARRGNPVAAAEEEARTPREDGVGRKLSDFEKEALFQEWVKRSLGTNPDKMDDEAYSSSFEAFKTHMFRSPVEDTPPPNSARPAEPPPRHPRENSDLSEDMEEEFTPVDSRVKELYRRLVRRLHPDLRADGSAAVSALWHEVQEAYMASDVARLEILLALSDIEANRLADQSVGQLRAVLAELERAEWALEKSLLEARSEDAWDFARIGSSKELRARVERQLKSDLSGRTQRLELLTRTIAEWAKGPVIERKVRRFA